MIFQLPQKAVHSEEKGSTSHPNIWCAEEIELLAKFFEFFSQGLTAG
jgi:hypothetical protein